MYHRTISGSDYIRQIHFPASDGWEKYSKGFGQEQADGVLCVIFPPLLETARRLRVQKRPLNIHG